MKETEEKEAKAKYHTDNMNQRFSLTEIDAEQDGVIYNLTAEIYS